jgi:hypothetical protein
MPGPKATADEIRELAAESGDWRRGFTYDAVGHRCCGGALQGQLLHGAPPVTGCPLCTGPLQR